MINRLPASLVQFLAEVESLGFSLILVGGAPRDFLASGIVGHDLDFEIRADHPISIDKWPGYYQRLIDFLVAKKISYKVLPYLITRVELGEFKLEFSSPRTEKHLENNLSHHHFEATLDSNLSPETSFVRRDFTINAIGLKFDCKNLKEVLIDPFSGTEDLKRGVLKAVSDAFYDDAVRFLRLIRFQLKFRHFTLEVQLQRNLARFNLLKLSPHHFKEEMFKSEPSKFLNLFSTLVKDHNIPLDLSFHVWIKYRFPEELKTREELFGFVFLQDKQDGEQVASFFSLPSKLMKELPSFLDSYELLSKADLSIWKTLAQQSPEQILKDPLLKACKNLEEKKQWFAILKLDSMTMAFGPQDWKSVVVLPEELAAVDPSVRSFLPYKKALVIKFKS